MLFQLGLQEVFLGGEFAVEAEELLLFFGEGLWVVVVVLVEGLGGAGGSGYARDGCTYADIDFVLLVRVHLCCMGSFVPNVWGADKGWCCFQSEAVGLAPSFSRAAVRRVTGSFRVLQS